MTVSKRTRHEVMRRDNFTCRYCRSADNPLTIDHVTPVALGGTDDPDNLVAACRDCNYGKASSAPDATMVADVKEDAVRWAAAMKVAASNLTKREQPLVDYISAFRSELEDYEAIESQVFGVPHDWQVTAGQFFRAGLPVTHLNHALNLAMANRAVPPRGVWRYMCGIAWNMVREVQEEARRIIESEG